MQLHYLTRFYYYHQLAIRAAPFYEDFIKCLLINPEDMEAGGEEQVLADLRASVKPMGMVVDDLRQYYYTENLESQAQV